MDINVDFPNRLDVLALHAKVPNSIYKVSKVKRYEPLGAFHVDIVSTG